ncbi:MAG: hypothetical protein HC866_03480 [Leptolyngbyaceae cyanobacterium RU_5_1]|nr:hypothetical protein [Leptolyngbyaceae cyanobacterium RU_5_1]
MRQLTKIAAGILLGIGVPITLLSTIGVMDLKAPSKDREGALAALILFGLPPTALGGWLVWSARQRSSKQEGDRLRSTFFRLLKESNGHLTVLRFSMETELDGEAAKAYLDDRAKEFNAIYNVTEEGNFSYYFNLDGSDGSKQLESGS